MNTMSISGYVNPFRTDPDVSWLFTKWGQPTNLGSDDDGFRYRCDICLASWVGPNGDYCDWCHQRWTIQTADRHQALLIPEWLLWDATYFGLGSESQAVWEETRGHTAHFYRAWFARLLKAKANGEITNNEAVAAGKRFKVWMMRKQSKPLKDSSGS